MYVYIYINIYIYIERERCTYTCMYTYVQLESEAPTACWSTAWRRPWISWIVCTRSPLEDSVFSDPAPGKSYATIYEQMGS